MLLRFATNSRKLEHGLRVIRAGIPFSIPFNFGGWGEGCSKLWCLPDVGVLRARGRWWMQKVSGKGLGFRVPYPAAELP